VSAILDKLLKGQKVEWLPINEIVLPTKNIKWKDVDSIYQYIDLTSVDRKTNAIIETSLIDKENAPSRAQKIVEHNDIIFATTRPTQMRIAVITEELHEQIASTGYCILRADIKIVLPKWIYYNLSSVSFKNYLEENESGSAYPAISDTKLKEFKIPIPPLDAQAEIVRILDAFTAVTAELTAELNMREKQYQYYRDKLLSFSSDEINWKKLGDIGEVRMCKRILKNQTAPSGDIPFYKIGTFGKQADAYISKSLFDEYKQKYSYPKIGEILISASGTIGRTVIFDGKDAYFQDSNIVWIENDENLILNKFLFYYYQIVNWGASEGGTISRLYNDNIRKINIPIPPISEQKRIIEILDKFETLTHSITEGLPKEIALRKQQYEYYREQLLDFPKN
jgi:type I restriction enzyme S subunit